MNDETPHRPRSLRRRTARQWRFKAQSPGAVGAGAKRRAVGEAFGGAGPPRALFAGACLLSALGLAAVAEDGGLPCSDLYQLATAEMYDKHVWTALEQFRRMEPTCAGAENEPLYHSFRGQLESYVVNHQAALRYFDARTSRRPQEPEALPREVSSRPALPDIVERANDHQIVIVNERHHASSDRLLTLALLKPLFEQGFRYLAAEAVWHGDSDLNERGYAVTETGYYANDVVFAELIRQALALGYTLVPYEHRGDQSPTDDSMTAQQTRDYWQAQNIVQQTLAKNAGAKVLIHCGYGHSRETPASNWTPMAYYLHLATGVDPLTIEQTVLSERSDPSLAAPTRIAALRQGLLGDEPVLLVDAQGELVPPPSAARDISVLGRQTTYENGRPSWMRMGDLREPIAVEVPECAEDACIVEAVDASQPDAVAYDRVETTAHSVILYLPPSTDVDVASYALDGTLRARRTVSTDSD